MKPCAVVPESHLRLETTNGRGKAFLETALVETRAFSSTKATISHNDNTYQVGHVLMACKDEEHESKECEE